MVDDTIVLEYWYGVEYFIAITYVSVSLEANVNGLASKYVTVDAVADFSWKSQKWRSLLILGPPAFFQLAHCISKGRWLKLFYLRLCFLGPL